MCCLAEQCDSPGPGVLRICCEDIATPKGLWAGVGQCLSQCRVYTNTTSGVRKATLLHGIVAKTDSSVRHAAPSVCICYRVTVMLLWYTPILYISPQFVTGRSRTRGALMLPQVQLQAHKHMQLRCCRSLLQQQLPSTDMPACRCCCWHADSDNHKLCCCNHSRC